MIEYTVKVDKRGHKEWRLNGKLHREDGPAVEWAGGTKSWYLNGELHREDGPAIEWADGTKFWYLNGDRNREDGPAIEYADGSKSWYIDDVELTEKEFKARNKCNKIVTIDGVDYELKEVVK